MRHHLNLLQLLCLAGLFLVVVSCGDSAPANDQPDAVDNTTVSNEENGGETATTTPEPVEAPNAIIAEKKVGNFALQQPMPEGGYTVAKEVKTTQAEGQTQETPMYMVKDGGTVLLEITPAYDLDADAYTDQPGEILVRDARFKTAENMGVGSTVEEIMAAYGDVDLWYTYVSGNYIAQPKSMNSVQFLIDPGAYVGTGDLNSSDRVDLTKDDFKPNAPIVSVRVY